MLARRLFPDPFGRDIRMMGSNFAFQQLACGGSRHGSCNLGFGFLLRRDSRRCRHGWGSGQRRLLWNSSFLQTGDDFVLGSRYQLVVLLCVLEEVGNIEERVALQTDIDERRLHSRQYLRHSSFIDIAHDSFRALSLDHEFDEFVVL
jgi:hypothetical protein